MRVALYSRSPWVVGMSDDSKDPRFSFRLGPMNEVRRGDVVVSISSPPNIDRDVLEVRERFRKIRKPVDALAMFKELGPWQLKRAFDQTGVPVRFSEVLSHQAEIEQVLTAEGGDEVYRAVRDFNFFRHLPMELVLADPPFAQSPCKDIKDAIRASVFLERLEGGIWRRCHSPTCNQIFKMKAGSTRKRIYCGYDCAHLQAVKKSNARKVAAGGEKKR
jgi:hypothetical protein